MGKNKETTSYEYYGFAKEEKENMIPYYEGAGNFGFNISPEKLKSFSKQIQKTLRCIRSKKNLKKKTTPYADLFSKPKKKHIPVYEV